MHRASVLLAALCASLASGEEPLSTEQLARLARAEDAAAARVREGHENRKDMTAGDRRALVEEQTRATEEAFRKEGVTAKSYARRAATLSLGERRAVAEEVHRQEVEARARQDAADSAARAPPVTVERGIRSDEKAIDIEVPPDVLAR